MQTIAMRLMVCTALAASMMFGAAKRAEKAPAKAASQTPELRDTVRVGVWTLWHDRQIVLAPVANGSGFKLRSCAQCAELILSRPTEVHAEGNRLTFATAGKPGYADYLWIKGKVTLAAHGERLTLIYPVTIAAHEGSLVIAVTLPVENYVERVVASESGPQDTSESLKALAVVVRTFALHEAHGHADFDLCDSTHCQLLHWGGGSGQANAAHTVALATAGETLWYKGRRALGYFNKDCGGRSAYFTEIWPRGAQIPYLASRTDRFCTSAGNQEWASEVTQSDLSSALAARGLVQPGWQSLAIGRRGDSGRAVTVRVAGKEISAEDFRLAIGERLGWNRVPSTWFELHQQGDRFIFHGRGWGHGVGLCQKGAVVMAKQGAQKIQILDNYFPGAAAADEQTGRTWRRLAGNGFVLESLDADDDAFVSEIAHARAEASERSGFNSAQPFIVRSFAGTAEFRAATLAPGWVSAFTEGDWIGTQPLRTLAARHLLLGTMRHEFLHALVEEHSGPASPLWLREGLVEAWGGNGAERRTRAHVLAPATIDAMLAHASSEEESEAAHRASGQYAAQLLEQHGRATVLDWLRSGVPANILAELRRREQH